MYSCNHLVLITLYFALFLHGNCFHAAVFITVIFIDCLIYELVTAPVFLRCLLGAGPVLCLWNE